MVGGRPDPVPSVDLLLPGVVYAEHGASTAASNASSTVLDPYEDGPP